MLLLSEAATGRVLWKKAFLEILQISWEAGLINCGFPVGFAKFLRASVLNNICEQLLLHCCDFAFFFSILWYNVLLIFNHFTCYLGISQDQLSPSVFSWSLTYLARALVMFPFFLFSNNFCNQGFIKQNFTLSLYYLYCAEVMLLFIKAFHHSLHLPTAQRFFYFSLLSMLQLEVSKWLHMYKWNKFNYASVTDHVCKFLLSVFYCSGVK